MLLQAMRWSHREVDLGELTFVIILNDNKCVNCAMHQHVDLATLGAPLLLTFDCGKREPEA